MKNTILASAIIIMAVFLLRCNNQESADRQNPESICQKNLERCERLENEMLVCIAFVEDFISKPYFCGARWTIGYGSTVLADGKRVTKKTPAISKAKAKNLTLSHIRKHIYPFFKYVKRELSDEEILGTVMFIYNIGGENFSGYDEKHNKIPGKKASSFLTAVNKGERGIDCATKMTGFCASGNKRANGLLKRHWVQGAVFCGILTPQMLLDLQPAKFYKTKNMGNYYYLDKKRNIIREDGFYCLNFDESIQRVFIKMNAGKKKTADILDDKTLKYFR